MMSILTASAAVVCIAGTLFVAGRLWRKAPTPACGFAIGAIGVSHMTREDAAAAGMQWGVRVEPGVVCIGGPRTVVSFVSRSTRESNGWYRVIVNVPGVRFKLGPLGPTER